MATRAGKKKKGSKRLLTCSAILLVIALAATGAAWLSAGALIESATRRAIPTVVELAEREGVSLEGVGFRSARLRPLAAVEWTGLYGTAQLSAGREFARDRSIAQSDSFDASAKSAKVRLLSWSEGRAELEARDVRLRLAPAPSSGSSSFEELEGADFSIESLRMPVRIDRENPRESLKELASIVSTLQASGTTTAELEFTGSGRFPFKGEMRELGIETQRSGGITTIVLRKEELRALAGLFERELTEAEIDVIALNPVKAPTLLRIKDMAERTAQDAAEADRSVPQDAYRHVLWSFTLTKEFGPEFAETVTDAHEVGSTTNTAADHRMDYNNNAIGRRYAAEGRRQDDLLRLVKTEPDVIRSPT